MNVLRWAGDLAALGEWAVETSLAATGLALGLLLLRRLRLRWMGPVWVHGAGYVLLVRLFLPVVPESSWAWNAWWRTVKEENVQAAPLMGPAMPGPSPAMGAGETPWQSFEVGEDPAGELPEKAVDFNEGPPEVVRMSAWAWVGAVWAGGAVVALCAAVLRHWVFWRGLRRKWRPVRLPWPHLPAQCAMLAGWRGGLRVGVMDGGGSPVVSGLFRPVILFPKETLEVLTGDEARHVLVHECLHLRHRDLWINACVSVAWAVHWFNPGVRRALRAWLTNRELIRDAETLRRLAALPDERQSYGRTLLKLAQPLSQPRPSPGLVVRMSSEKDIHRRIVMITQNPTPPPRHRLALAGAVAAALSTAFFTTAADTPKPADGAIPPVAETPPPPPVVEPPKAAPAPAADPAPAAENVPATPGLVSPSAAGGAVPGIPTPTVPGVPAGPIPGGVGEGVRVGAGVPTPMPPLTPRATVGKALPDVPQRPGVAVAKPGGSPRDVQAQLDELNRGMQEIRSMLGALTQQRQAEARIGWTAAAAAEIAEASAKGLGPRHPDVVKAKESAIADMKALPPVSTPLPELRIELEMAQDELRELETSGGGSAITEPVRNAAKRRVERLARLIEYRQKLSDYEQESRNRTAADAEKAAAERYALVAETIALQKQILELEHMLKGAVGEKAEEIQTKLLNARMKLIEGEVRLKEMPRKD